MKPKKILICGLANSGSNYVTYRLKQRMEIEAIDVRGEFVRNMTNNKDFSFEGYKVEIGNLLDVANQAIENGYNAIIETDCPYDALRESINADIVVYVSIIPDNIPAEKIEEYEKVTTYDYLLGMGIHFDPFIDDIYLDLKESEFDHAKPTGLMIGDYDTFSEEHKITFNNLMQTHGQVCIAVRDKPTENSNVFESVGKIRREFIDYAGKFLVVVVPNIAEVVQH